MLNSKNSEKNMPTTIGWCFRIMFVVMRALYIYIKTKQENCIQSEQLNLQSS